MQTNITRLHTLNMQSVIWPAGGAITPLKHSVYDAVHICTGICNIKDMVCTSSVPNMGGGKHMKCNSLEGMNVRIQSLSDASVYIIVLL